MKTQAFDWGTIEWIYTPHPSSHDNMHIGISTIWPHTKQTKHVHCGDEQLMYIIKGQGEQTIDGNTSKIAPGHIYHLSAGSLHETINDSDEPIVKLLVSIPVVLPSCDGITDEGLAYKQLQRSESAQAKVDLSSILEQLYEKLIMPLKLPLAFFDREQKLLLRNNEYPEYCKQKCHVDENIENCTLYSFSGHHTPPYYTDASAYICQHGISLYSLAIMYKDEVIGFMKAGHVRIAGGSEEDVHGSVYEVPQSTITGIVQTMHRLAAQICDLYLFKDLQMELVKQEGNLTEQEIQKTILQESLLSTQTEMFNLHIEQHFLFNTLSTIAGMAIRDNAIPTYRAINDLAQLFRYTLKTSRLFVELREELEYVENYTNLQQLRYGSRLEIAYICPAALYKEMVPFNFIQPVVENCFKHAFQKQRTDGNMRITVRIKKVNATLEITVRDNGSGISAEMLQTINNRIHSIDRNGGTSMLVQKLSALYGNNYAFKVESLKRGTKAVIIIPQSGRANKI